MSELETEPQADATQPLPRLARIPGGMLEEAIDAHVGEAEAAGKIPGVVRLRMQPLLYFARTATERQRYEPWPGVNWIVDLTPEQAKAFRRELDAWVQEWVMRQSGPDGVRG